MQQYDLLMADDNALQQLWEDWQQVVCPVCKKGNLSCDTLHQRILCTLCSIILPARASLQEIEDRIYRIINTHSESGCFGDTNFFFSAEDTSLYAHCNTCSFLDLAL